MDVIDGATSTECGHVFCKRCIDGHVAHARQSANEVRCPLCNVRVNGALLRSVEDLRYGILASLRHGCSKGNDEVSIDAPALELLQQMMIGVLDTVADNIVRVARGRPMDDHPTDEPVGAAPHGDGSAGASNTDDAHVGIEACNASGAEKEEQKRSRYSLLLLGWPSIIPYTVNVFAFSSNAVHTRGFL